MGEAVNLFPSEEEFNSRLMQSAMIFAECLAGDAAKNRGVPLTDDLRREVAHEIGARFIAKDVTPKPATK